MTEIMGLSKQSEGLYDPLRKKWVKATPEENIRQGLIELMLRGLGFPSALISVEVELSQLPHVQPLCQNVPKRRADVIAFAKGIHPTYDLFPLLMVECKSVPLTEKFARQVIGYNAFVQAPFLGLANAKHFLFGYYDEMSKTYLFESKLPSYSALLARLSHIADSVEKNTTESATK